MQVDLADDRFDVTYDEQHVAIAHLLETIADLEFEPETVKQAPTVTRSNTTRVDLTALPTDLAALFGEARDQDKPVLLRFSGPG